MRTGAAAHGTGPEEMAHDIGGSVYHKYLLNAASLGDIYSTYRYSAIKEYLTGLELETNQALRDIYGFSSPLIRRRRDLQQQEAIPEEKLEYFKEIKLFNIRSINGNEVVTDDIRTGRRSRMNARVVHQNRERTAGNIVGYKLCDPNNSSDCTVFTFSSAINAIQEWYRLHYTNILAKIPTEKKIAMGYSAEELFISCSFDGQSCSARDFTLFTHPLYGNCYTFNDASREQLFVSSMGGAEAGLKLVIFIDEEEYNPFLVTAAGAKILVHDQNDYPFIEESGTELQTAAQTSIGMHLTESSKLSSPYSECTIDGSDILVPNLYNKTYTYQICLYSCFQLEMVKTCGCAHYDQPLPEGAKYCNYEEYPSWIYCYFKLHKRFVQEELGCQETCRESCSFKEWSFIRSVADWPSVRSEEWTLRILSWELGSKLDKNLTNSSPALRFFSRSPVILPGSSVIFCSFAALLLAVARSSPSSPSLFSSSNVDITLSPAVMPFVAHRSHGITTGESVESTSEEEKREEDDGEDRAKKQKSSKRAEDSGEGEKRPESGRKQESAKKSEETPRAA
ncbi:hypothetical protein AB205_0106850 [Aquarana catesbeiana]|uniref:Uncharacterized protein n=1 Tax=Aquarana catesbeiana TaxID=8400 RepID=A0A2G9S9V4_AQUCT|nr:hypothetical protein AB205_0106850 [Aquarana catesbeiana]